MKHSNICESVYVMLQRNARCESWIRAKTLIYVNNDVQMKRKWEWLNFAYMVRVIFISKHLIIIYEWWKIMFRQYIRVLDLLSNESIRYAIKIYQLLYILQLFVKSVWIIESHRSSSCGIVIASSTNSWLHLKLEVWCEYL